MHVPKVGPTGHWNSMVCHSTETHLILYPFTLIVPTTSLCYTLYTRNEGLFLLFGGYHSVIFEICTLIK